MLPQRKSVCGGYVYRCNCVRAMAEINIYGLLHCKAADGKLARTAQVFDEGEQEFQSAINAKTVRSVTARGVDITENAPSKQDNILYIEVKPETDGQ